MNKTELIDAMASKTGMTKKNAEAALNAFVETVSEELVKGGKVALTALVLLKYLRDLKEKAEILRQARQ